MSIWSDIGQFIQETAAEALSTVVERIRTVFVGDAATRKRVAFSVAIIALSAKMAKADGIVSDAEVSAFRDIFDVPEEEMGHVARLYNLAKQDVAGYTSYGKQVRSLFPGDDESDADILKDVLDGLFHIAKADGVVHENELLFLEDLSVLFGFSETAFARIKCAHFSDGEADAYRVLDASPEWDLARLKKQYRSKVSQNHPDRLIARGVPPEFISIATDRLAAINAAWEKIEPLHQPVPAAIPVAIVTP